MKNIFAIVIVVAAVIFFAMRNFKSDNIGHDYPDEYSEQDKEISYQLCDSAETLIHAGIYKEAEILLRKSMHLYSGNATAYNDMGGLKWNTHYPFDTVVRYYTTSEKIAPYYISPYRNLAFYYLSNRMYIETIDEVQRLIANVRIRNKDDSLRLSEALSFSGDAKLRIEKISDAMVDLNKSIKINPLNAFSYQMLGECYIYSGLAQKAIECEDISLQLEPLEKPAYKHNDRAIAYQMFGKYRLALNDYDTALNYKVLNSKSVYFNRGMLYVDMKMKEKAISDLVIADSLGHPSAKEYIRKIRSGIKFTKIGDILKQ